MADTKAETPADELRKAAAALRRVAARTTPGRWVCGNLEEREDFTRQIAISSGEALVAEINLSATDANWRYMRDLAVRDGQWIALASPALAAPLAASLEAAAGLIDGYPDLARPHVDGEPGDDHACHIVLSALAVARAINGTAS